MAPDELSPEGALRVLAGASREVQAAVTVFLGDQLQKLQDQHAAQMSQLLEQRAAETQKLREVYAQRQAQLERVPVPPEERPAPVVEAPAPVVAAPLDHIGLVALIRQVAIEVVQSTFRDQNQQAVNHVPQTALPFAQPAMIDPRAGWPMYNPHTGRRY